MKRIEVQLGPRSYPILIDADSGPGACAAQHTPGRSALVVGDTNTSTHAQSVADRLADSGFHVVRHDVPAGEESKCLEQAGRLYDVLAGMRADRKALVVAVGGGVVGDLAGFAAATYNRGLPLFMVPTTLLAMVDSSVGGKVGINHAAGKNLIGAFHQPVVVWIETKMLQTLPEREYLSGLAEVVKYGVIFDAEFFAWLESHIAQLLRRDRDAVEHVIERSCRLKADVVEKDEYERHGLRAALNYGHTFGHAFEAVAGYGAWLHGEAVAAGMMCAARMAASRSLIAPGIVERQQALLQALGLPVAPDSWPVADLITAMHTDKKAEAGRLRFILPVELGKVQTFDDVTDAEVRTALALA